MDHNALELLSINYFHLLSLEFVVKSDLYLLELSFVVKELHHFLDEVNDPTPVHLCDELRFSKQVVVDDRVDDEVLDPAVVVGCFEESFSILVEVLIFKHGDHALDDVEACSELVRNGADNAAFKLVHLLVVNRLEVHRGVVEVEKDRSGLLLVVKLGFDTNLNDYLVALVEFSLRELAEELGLKFVDLSLGFFVSFHKLDEYAVEVDELLFVILMGDLQVKLAEVEGELVLDVVKVDVQMG